MCSRCKRVSQEQTHFSSPVETHPQFEMVSMVFFFFTRLLFYHFVFNYASHFFLYSFVKLFYGEDMSFFVCFFLSFFFSFFFENRDIMFFSQIFYPKPFLYQLKVEYHACECPFFIQNILIFNDSMYFYCRQTSLRNKLKSKTVHCVLAIRDRSVSFAIHESSFWEVKHFNLFLNIEK